MSESHTRVLEILPGNRASVATEGLCRRVIRDTGERYDEFVELPMAHMRTGGDDFLEAISYPTFDPCGLIMREEVEGVPRPEEVSR